MSSSNVAAPASANQFICDVCHRQLKTQRGFDRHRATHDRLSCDDCGARFARADTLAMHNMSFHGINTPHVCHMEDCHRRGLGLTSHDLLIDHLDRRHQGATVADNDAARQNKEVPSEDDQSQNAHSDTNAQSDEQMEDADDRDFNGDEYKSRISNLQEQLEEEREGHHMEIADIHKMYKKKLKELYHKAVDQDLREVKKSIKETYKSIPS
ncbi:hypothetical protein PG993_008935 [Apiospora rasikravindrae]|uniref:C2H2-type domain-containing protein n=1 Tax=Apiospora rasikravindrae TaxID=990691 RepID=A0ABR1SR60_9PEZI